ncbi:MAG TPA: glycosyltransferase [Opitutaceae bacterium]
MKPPRLLTFIAARTGGVGIFWENLCRQFPSIDIVRVAEAERTWFDRTSRTLHVSPFDPLHHVHGLLARELDLTQYDALVANERFELEFFLSRAAGRPVVFIVHGNHPHYYGTVLRYAGHIDRILCVSATAVAYLRAHGVAHAVEFAYSIFVDVPPAPLRRDRVVYVGRFEPDKNIHETFAIFQFLKRQAYEVRLIGVGSLASEIAAQFDPAEVLVGLPREAVLAEMAQARFLCLNSYVEGLPVTYLEARHFQLGVLCSYLDSSMHRVLGANATLCSDLDALLRWMRAFSFQPPASPARVNNPALNDTLLSLIASTPVNTSTLPSPTIGGWLDRTTWLPPRLVGTLRRARWQARRPSA